MEGGCRVTWMDHYASLYIVMMMLIGVRTVVRLDNNYYDECKDRENKFSLFKIIKKEKIMDAIIFIGVFLFMYMLFHKHLHDDMEKYSLSGYFFQLSLYHQICFCLFTMICFLSFLLAALPAFRSYVMVKLQLEPKRRVHCIVVYWMMYTMAYLAVGQVVGLRPNWQGDFGDLAHDVIAVSKNIIIALLAVGMGVTRNGRETWVRLQLHKKPTWTGFWISNLLLIALFIFSSLMTHVGTIWGFLPPGELDGLSLFHWCSFLIGGILAGVSEELWFRGALQPRLGIWVTSVLFSAEHVHYYWWLLPTLFLWSLCVGWLARRYSLWLSIWFHVCYNIIVVVINI